MPLSERKWCRCGIDLPLSDMQLLSALSHCVMTHVQQEP